MVANNPPARRHRRHHPHRPVAPTAPRLQRGAGPPPAAYRLQEPLTSQSAGTSCRGAFTALRLLVVEVQPPQLVRRRDLQWKLSDACGSRCPPAGVKRRADLQHRHLAPPPPPAAKPGPVHTSAGHQVRSWLKAASAGLSAHQCGLERTSRPAAPTPRLDQRARAAKPTSALYKRAPRPPIAPKLSRPPPPPAQEKCATACRSARHTPLSPPQQIPPPSPPGSAQ